MGVLDHLIGQQKAAATAYAEVLMGEVIGHAQRIVPHDEGTLEGTGTVHPPVTVGDTTVVIGSFSTPYARRQHEELDWKHLPGRQAKYLEDPFKRVAIPQFQAGMARAVAAVTR